LNVQRSKPPLTPWHSLAWGLTSSGSLLGKHESLKWVLPIFILPRWQFSFRNYWLLLTLLEDSLGDHLVFTWEVSLWSFQHPASGSYRLKWGSLVPIFYPCLLHPAFPFSLSYPPPTWFILKILEKLLDGRARKGSRWQSSLAVPVKWRKAVTGPGWRLGIDVVCLLALHLSLLQPQMPASVVTTLGWGGKPNSEGRWLPQGVSLSFPYRSPSKTGILCKPWKRQMPVYSVCPCSTCSSSQLKILPLPLHPLPPSILN
jgi:hypothetical protein